MKQNKNKRLLSRVMIARPVKAENLLFNLYGTES